MNLTLASGEQKEAVTPVIGFILVFLIGIILFSLYNTAIIPNQDFQKEITHSENIREDMSTFREGILTASSGTRQSVQLKLGVNYGGVSFTGVHSAPTSGTVQVSQYNGVPSEMRIENAVGVGGTTDKFWNGTQRSYKTQYVAYESNYNYYQTAPKLYVDSTVLYSDFQQQVDRKIIESDQSLIKGNQISLTTITGNTTTTSYGQKTLQIEPVSASTDTITITSQNTTNPITIQFASNLNVSRWRNILSNQTDENGGYVTGITEAQTSSEYGTNLIELTLQTNTNYQLSLSKLHIQSTDSQTPTLEQKPQYVDWKGNDSVAVVTDSRSTIDATVRDRFNNPVSGTKVYARVNQTGTSSCIGSFTSATNTCLGPGGNSYQQPGVKTSDSTGETTFVYQAPSSDVTTEYNGNFTISLTD